MSEIVVLHVPEPAVDAAVAGSRVWCAAGGRLMAFEAGSGDQQADLAAPPGIVSLAASDAVLAGVSKSGVVHVLDPATGQERYRWPLGSEVDLRGEAGSVWAVDHRFQRLWMLPPDGRPTRAVPAPGVEEVAPHGERVFWASRGDTFLHGGDRLVDLGVGPRGSGRDGRLRGLPLDQRAGLLRVGLWALEVGPLVEAPEGPVAFLACGGGLLAGGSGLAGLFVIDFLRDDGLRHLDVDLGGPLRALVTTREAVWALPEDRREIRLVRLP